MIPHFAVDEDGNVPCKEFRSMKVYFDHARRVDQSALG